MSILYRIFVLMVLCITVSQAQQADSVKKTLPVNWMRPREVDIKHLAIDLRFDWKKKQAYGSTAITLTPFNATNLVTLDAGMLTIHSIMLNGNLLKFTYDGGDRNDGLLIILDRIYKSSEDLTLVIQYNTNWINKTDPNNLGGSTGKGIRFFEPTLTEPNRRKQIWSMGESELNRYWFPGFDSPSDLRTTEFRATVEKPLSVISNGILIETKDNADGSRTFYYKSNTPYANHLTSFVVGEYVDAKQTYENVALHNYSYPDEIAATTASVERLPDMVKFFSDLTGAKYPYPSYSQIFVQDLPYGMPGYATSAQTENMVDDYGTHKDFLYLWDALEGESLAKQWFGSYLTPRNWSENWLNRGFARYFTNLYDEYRNGRDEFLMYQLSFDHGIYLADWGSGFREPIVNKNYDNGEVFTTASNYPYFRGAAVLHMLRKHLGDENWKKAIRIYVKSNANKLVTTEDFRNAVEEASGESMDWFFDQWLYKIGHPVFVVTKSYDVSKKQLTLTVTQTQKPDSAAIYSHVDYFKGKVDIDIDGNIQHVWLEPKEANTFIFTSAQSPKLVNFDYQKTWIAEIKFEKSFEEFLYQFQNDTDVLNHQIAMGEIVKTARDPKTTMADKQRIYAAFRNVITGNGWWRKRGMAMTQLRTLIAPATDGKAEKLDDVTTKMLLNIIKTDSCWVKAGAINFLGMTRDQKYVDIYLNAFKDPSDRVVNAAAIALGKTKSPKAYNALVKLISKPSWKNQSLISALNGLKELGDPRGYDIAYKALADVTLARWSLPTTLWDYRITATETIVALKRGADVYPMMLERFKKSMEEGDLNVIFNNVNLLSILADPRGKEVVELLKARFKGDENAMVAVGQYEEAYKETKK